MSTKRNSPFVSNRAEIARVFLDSGLTREEFAAKIGVNENTLGRLLKREKIELLYETARKIRRACGVDAVMLR